MRSPTRPHVNYALSLVFSDFVTPSAVEQRGGRAVSTQEQRRAVVLERVVQGLMTAGAAAAGLGLSLRQLRRLVAAYREDGAAALRHANQGRRPARALSAAARARVIALVQ